MGFGLEASPFQILEESDIDRDGTINLSEFQHVISRSPDFARYDCGLHLLHQVWDVISGGGPWGRKRPPASSEYIRRGLTSRKDSLPIPRGLGGGVNLRFSPYPPLSAESPNTLFSCSVPLRLSCDGSHSMCSSTLLKKSTAELWSWLPLCCQRRPSWPSLELALSSLARGCGGPSTSGPFPFSLSSLYLCFY